MAVKFRGTLNLDYYNIKTIRFQEVGTDIIEISVLHEAYKDTDEEEPDHLTRFIKKVRVELDKYFPEFDYSTTGKNIFVIRSICPHYLLLKQICMEGVKTAKDLALLKLSGKYPSEVIQFYRDLFMNDE